MKKLYLFFLIAFLSSSCATAVTAIPTVTPQPTETLTPSPTATETTIPTITPTPTQIGGGSGKFIFEYYKAAYEKRYPNLKGEVNVFISNWDGTYLTPVTSGLKGFNHIEDISADGQMALISSRSSQLAKGDLYLLRLNSLGSDPVKLAGGVEAISVWPQARFLDSNQMVYIAQGSRGYGFYKANIDGTNANKIGAPTGKAWGIASSDKSRIYWFGITSRNVRDSITGALLGSGDSVSLWWANVDGSGQGKLESNGAQIFPAGIAFSPDGKSIAWIPADFEPDCSFLYWDFWTPYIRDGSYTKMAGKISIVRNESSPHFGKVIDTAYIEDYVARCFLMHVASLDNMDNDTKIPLSLPFDPDKDDFLYHKGYVLTWWPDSSKILAYSGGYAIDGSDSYPMTLFEIDLKDVNPGLGVLRILPNSLVFKPEFGPPRFVDSFGSFKFSPDGRQLLFTKNQYGDLDSMINVLNLETLSFIDGISHNITPDIQLKHVGNIYWLP